MQAGTEQTATEDRERIGPRMSAFEAAGFQIAPGAANLLVFVLAAFVLDRLGLPVIFALGAGILLAEVPVSWGLMMRRVKRETGGRFSLADAFPWRRRVPLWVYLVIGVPVIVLSMALMLGLLRPISDFLLPTFFWWLPSWFVLDVSAEQMADLPRHVILARWPMSVIVFTLIGGVTQELYARGFLLPRIEPMGPIAAPIWNAAAFAVLHLAAPWNWHSFFLASLIWAVLVWWTRSVKIGLFAHVGMLALQSVGLALLAFGIVSPSGAAR